MSDDLRVAGPDKFQTNFERYARNAAAAGRRRAGVQFCILQLLPKAAPTKHGAETGQMRMTRRDTLIAAGAAALPSTANATPRLTSAIEITTGRVRGARVEGVSSFLGIPYGADTSAHRFQPVPAPASWSGIRDCVAIGHQAPQMDPSAAFAGGAALNTPFLQQMLAATKQGMEVGNESEDCLVLNVYTPEASRARKRPVLFWMHGGGFAIGSGGDLQYNGAPLARRGDVVVVTVNHRLNALGFLYLGAMHDDFADSGNIGMLDLVLALQWVRDNIEAFGGDPGNITIFGESGGGAKVSTTLAMPPAQGLFHKAVIQSGAALTGVGHDQAADFAQRLLAALNVAPADVHQLQAMDYRQIIAAAMTIPGGGIGGGGQGLAPVVDGRSLPRHPFEPDAPETARGIPLMIGTTRDEATLFSAIDPLFPDGTAEQVRARFQQILPEHGDAAFALYQTLRPNDAPAYLYTAMLTDRTMRMNSIRLAERKIAQDAGPVYMYRVDYEPEFLDGVLKSPHGTDVPLVFDTVDARQLEFGAGDAPRRLAAIVSQAWINFARSADPSQAGLAWPPYDTQARQTMIFDTDSGMVSDPDAPARQFWSSLP